VQLGFAYTVVELAGAGKLLPSHLSNVIFRQDVKQMLPRNWDEFSVAEQLEIMWDFIEGFEVELAAATPEDLASSDALDWAFIVRKGEVHRVTSEAEARKLLEWM
jgi:hypothetical protein